MSVAPLSSIAGVIRGVSFSKEEGDSVPSADRLPVIRAGSIQGTLLVNQGQIWVPKGKVKKHQMIRKDDIVMCTSSGSSDLVGKCAKAEVDFDGSFGAFCAGIRPDCKKVSPSYLYHFLSSPNFRNWTKSSSGANIKNIRISELAEFEIPLPPLPEQKRIAAILDKADAIRRKRQQAIQLADEFLRAVFLDMFGDPVTNPKGFPATKLGELCEDLFLGLTSKVDYIDGTDGYPLVRAKDINTGELSFDDVRYISEEQHRKLTKNHLTRKGDLLVSKSGTLGTCAIVRTDREFSTYESIFTVRPDRLRLDIHYLIHLLQNKGFKEKLLGNKVGGTVAHLNLKMFRDFEIGVPPIELQRMFSNTILKCEAKLDKYRKSGEESELLFNSLNQAAFSGEL